MIVRRDGGYEVVSQSGKNLGGPYQNEGDAARRLEQVDYFKHKSGGPRLPAGEPRESRSAVREKLEPHMEIRKAPPGVKTPGKLESE